MCACVTRRAYWDAWNEFEVRHGNEDTFREMLRIKRCVCVGGGDTGDLLYADLQLTVAAGCSSAHVLVVCWLVASEHTACWGLSWVVVGWVRIKRCVGRGPGVVWRPVGCQLT
jgi:hypothetical protein